MLFNKKPLVQSVVEPTDTNVYWVQVIPNSTATPIIKTFHNGAWTPLTGTPESIQDLLDLKAPLHNPEFTGAASFDGNISVGGTAGIEGDVLVSKNVTVDGDVRAYKNIVDNWLQFGPDAKIKIQTGTNGGTPIYREFPATELASNDLENPVKFVEQTLTDAQKLQARTNINAQKRIETANQSIVAGPGAWPNADIQQEGSDGYGNVALGVNAGNKLTTGNANSLIGNGVGGKVTTGNNNVAVGGTYALGSNVSGNENAAMGVRALSTILGSGNVGIGAYAGFKSGYNATGDNSVFLGKNATRKNNTTTNNEIVIGANAVGNGDNSMTLGDTSITDTRIRGEIDNPVFKNGFKLKRNSQTTAVGTVNYDPTVSVRLITGVGTNFSEFNAGDTFTFDNGGSTYSAEITYISSDTSMYVDTSTALGDEAYGVPYTIVPQEIVDIDMALYPDALKYATNAMNFNARVLPKFDDYYTLGSENQRWSQLYAGTTSIATSDARLKTVIVAFTQDELNAAKQLSKEIGTYKFLSAIAEKGESARKHIGMTVQRAIEIMQANNLNPFEYGFICFDSWDDEYKTIPAVEAVEAVEAYVETVEHDNGVIEKIFHAAIPAVEAKPEQTIKVKSAGEIYSFRYEELLAFICRGFEERLTALEEK